MSVSTVVSLLGQHTRRYLSHTGNWLFGSVQHRPTKSSINDGKFDGNDWGGTEITCVIQ